MNEALHTVIREAELRGVGFTVTPMVNRGGALVLFPAAGAGLLQALLEIAAAYPGTDLEYRASTGLTFFAPRDAATGDTAT